MLTSHIIRVAVEAALAEDAPYGDITCETTIPADETGSAHERHRHHDRRLRGRGERHLRR